MKDTIKRTFADMNIRTFRRKLASIDSLPQFALLGILSGALTGFVIVAFRYSIELPLTLLPGHTENFEGLAPLALLGLPIAGSAVLAWQRRLRRHVTFLEAFE